MGQPITVGDYVFRGARDGNSSSFKFGVVEKTTSNSIGVNWLYRPGGFWCDHPTRGRISFSGLPNKISSFGTVKDASSLCVLPPAEAQAILDYCTFWTDTATLARQGDTFALDKIERHFS